VEILGDLPQQKIRIAANTYQAIGAQQQLAVIAFDRFAEFDFGAGLPFSRQATPHRIELVESEPDDLAAFRGVLSHGANLTRIRGPRSGVCLRRSRRYARTMKKPIVPKTTV